MKVNFNKLKFYYYDILTEFRSKKTAKKQLLYEVKNIVEYLKTHNKNYTNEQYNKIDLLFDILNCLEV